MLYKRVLDVSVRLVTVFVPILVLSVAAVALTPGENLVLDPFVGRDEKSWWTHQLYRGNPEQIEFVIDENVTRTGGASLAIVSNDASNYGKWHFRLEPEPGVLKRGQTYRAQVWYKTEDHLGVGRQPEVRVRLASHAANWSEFHGTFLEVVGVTPDGWTLVAGELTLPQENPWNVLLELMIFESTGTIWFDGAELILVSE